MKFLYVIIFALMIPLVVSADEPRHKTSFTSANNKYELRSFSPGSWKLIEKSSEKSIYELTNDGLYAMTVLVSDDGDNIVAIDDYSEREATKDIEVLFFFEKGKLIKKYSLAEINGLAAVSYSVSHFSWVWLDKNISLTESKLGIKTYSLTNYTFDVKTGNILKKERDPALSEDAIYVYGEIIRKLGDNKYEMDVCTLVQGAIPKSGKIQFESEEPYIEVKRYRTVIIKNGKMVKTKTPYIFNSCNYK